MSKDIALETLGSLLSGTHRRDAIHIALAPVTAQVKLYPGQDVGADGTLEAPVGIVDPFLQQPVMPGEQFWLMLYPRTVTGMRHEWQHPAFADNAADLCGPPYVPEVQHISLRDVVDKRESEQWIQDYAEGLGLTYEDLVAAAGDYWKNGDYYSRGALLEGEYTDPKFWDHYMVVTGERVPEHCRRNFFTCSC
jgi:hypothetical protein